MTQVNLLALFSWTDDATELLRSSAAQWQQDCVATAVQVAMLEHNREKTVSDLGSLKRLFSIWLQAQAKKFSYDIIFDNGCTAS